MTAAQAFILALLACGALVRIVAIRHARRVAIETARKHLVARIWEVV